MSNELAKTNPNKNLPAAPNYMAVEGDTSLDTLKQYIRPSRIKIIQAQTDDELKNEFGLASVILVPDNILVANAAKNDVGNPNPEATPPFLFTPIYFFQEYCCWNDYKAKGKLPAIRSRSFDSNSMEAKRAKNFSLRREQDPNNPEWTLTYCEHLNYIIMLPGIPDPCIMTFAKGEFKAGANFAAFASARKVPLYGNIFAAHLAHRTSDKGNWYGLDIGNPPGDESPFVGEEAFHAYRLLYEEYKKLHEDRSIEVDYDAETIDAESSPSGAADTM